MNQNIRKTPQKQAIKDYLCSVTCHPNAEKVYIAVKKKWPHISKGTVYRNLQQMAARGEIQSLSGKVTCYDGNIHPHAHFICQNCERVIDLHRKFKILDLFKVKAGKIHYSQLYFYGICKKCEKNNK